MEPPLRRGIEGEGQAGWKLSREPTEICNPLCRYFRCARRMLNFRRNPPWCRWVNAPCIGYKCPYAQCLQVKMLPDGRCGLFVKRKTRESLETLRSPFKAETIDRVRKKLDRFGL